MTKPPFTLDDLQNLPPDQLLVLLAAVVQKHGDGPFGDKIRAFIQDLQTQVQAVATRVEADPPNDDDARKAAAAQIELLLESVMTIGKDVGTAVEPHRAKLQGAFASGDLSKVGDALALLASYLQDPSDERRAQAQAVVGDLEQTFGGLVGFDRLDEQRRAQIRGEVKQSMAKVMANKPMPTLEFKPKTPLPRASPPDAPDADSNDDGDEPK